MPRRSTTDTHQRLLDAGRALAERVGAAELTLEAVAREARVSRQTVYLHFKSRARFFFALADATGADAVFGAAEALVRDAPTADAALRRLIELRAARSAVSYKLTAAFHAVAHADPEMAGLWDKRQARRLHVFRALARRFHAERRLRRGMSVDDAAALMWASLSFENWYYLVHANKWPARRFVARTHQMLV